MNRRRTDPFSALDLDAREALGRLLGRMALLREGDSFDEIQEVWCHWRDYLSREQRQAIYRTPEWDHFQTIRRKSAAYREYQREYRRRRMAEDPAFAERIRRYQHDYQKVHADERREYHRKYQKKRRENDPEYAAKKREYNRRYREANRERIRDNQRKRREAKRLRDEDQGSGAQGSKARG